MSCDDVDEVDTVHLTGTCVADGGINKCVCVCVGLVCVSPLLPWCCMCEHRSGFSLWELPSGIHWSRVNWGGGVLRKVTQTGTSIQRCELLVG